MLWKTLALKQMKKYKLKLKISIVDLVSHVLFRSLENFITPQTYSSNICQTYLNMMFHLFIAS